MRTCSHVGCLPVQIHVLYQTVEVELNGIWMQSLCLIDDAQGNLIAESPDTLWILRDGDARRPLCGAISLVHVCFCSMAKSELDNQSCKQEEAT